MWESSLSHWVFGGAFYTLAQLRLLTVDTEASAIGHFLIQHFRSLHFTIVFSIWGACWAFIHLDLSTFSLWALRSVFGAFPGHTCLRLHGDLGLDSKAVFLVGAICLQNVLWWSNCLGLSCTSFTWIALLPHVFTLSVEANATHVFPFSPFP